MRGLTLQRALLDPPCRIHKPQFKYTCDLSLLPKDLRKIFVQLHADEDSSAFIEECRRSYETVDWTFKSFFTCFSRPILSHILGWSNTDIHGYLETGSMHLFSSSQLRQLLEVTDEKTQKFGFLLDIGAGDGNVTDKLAPLFHNVVTTEVSSSMINRLLQRGYECYKVDDLTKSPELMERRFDVISLLNVLDRCFSPMTLLKQILPLLRDSSSRLIVAVVLPFEPFVENGYKQSPPLEVLNCSSPRWEKSVEMLVKNVFVPCGYHVEMISRLPYISQGDGFHSLYVLDNAIFVLSRNEGINCDEQVDEYAFEFLR